MLSPREKQPGLLVQLYVEDRRIAYQLLGKRDHGISINCCVLEGGSGFGFPKSDVLLLII